MLRVWVGEGGSVGIPKNVSMSVATHTVSVIDTFHDSSVIFRLRFTGNTRGTVARRAMLVYSLNRTTPY